MTMQIVRQLAKTSIMAVVVVFLMLLFVLQSRYSIPAVAITAVIFAVYSENSFTKNHDVKYTI
ncbi:MULTISPECIES: hypothetical protein [Companilactobacillus]|uniref:Uncharacterized protein n=1 Tax=Companilactobacillus nodensis DSM 19682 = JCM 14932 = NBRC 107160 TaxID=1423775 RepID=A0A0R1K5Q7_9LACO|nr:MULTISPECIES: hypothetical protein [Companilactobacillus]KRK78934.1 hypothetical protein FD03_GL001293 [Companilactobacillus nodensis DSM 19682 = JCM 14932 = NBRC 107160]